MLYKFTLAKKKSNLLKESAFYKNNLVKEGNMSPKKMLNLGCGATFHEDWVNIDFTDQGGKVLAYDLRLGIPFVDNSFDVVYHSHILEHMPKAWGEFFLEECYRVLRPGGLLRVVLPDLENITRNYLDCLEAARRGEEGAEQRHQWMMVELIDQLTRSQSGGEMLNWWKQNPVPQENFIIERLGKEAAFGISHAKGQTPHTPKTALPPVDTSFLLSGEACKWMYDAVSLKTLLHQQGFENIQQVAYNESALSHMLQYGLDVQEDGSVRKPHSFFMEAIKPNSVEKKYPCVTIFSTSDAGGAGITCLRLHTASSDIGIQSRVLVAQQQFSQKGVHVIPSKPLSKGGGIIIDGHQAEKAVRKELQSYRQKLHQAMAHYPQRPQGSEYFSIPGQCVPLESVPYLEDTDIIHLHWVAGMLDPSLCLEYLRGKKIVWTLHDMNAFTGGCHYSNGCRKFEKMCGACPELGSTQERDLSFDIWRARMAAYRELDIHVVAPSQWLAQEARSSALFKNKPVFTFPYSHPVETYRLLDKEKIRASLGLTSEHLVLFFASQSLTNVRKGGIYLVQLLHLLAQTHLKEKIVVLLLGSNCSPEFKQVGVRVETLGFMNEPTQMIPLYNAADAMVVPSLEDNQPNVVAESLLCGTPVIAFKNTGIQEMINHMTTGYLAESKNVEQLLHGIIWADKARENGVTRRICRAHALERWAPDLGAKQYLELYKTILN